MLRSQKFQSTESDYSAAFKLFAILAFPNQVLSRYIGGLQDPRFGMIEIYIWLSKLPDGIIFPFLARDKAKFLALKACYLSLNYNPFVFLEEKQPGSIIVS